MRIKTSRDKLIDEIVAIKDRDVETQTDHDYDRRNSITKELFGTISLHDAFAHKHPEFCLKTVIWMDSYGPLNKITPKTEAEIYTSNGVIGASIKVHPKKKNLVDCLSGSSHHPNGAYLYFDQHSNIVWLDSKDKVIHRYDPQIGSDSSEAKSIDTAMKAFFVDFAPEYEYLGNTLTRDECVQGVRWKERGILDCFCQEYTLMYAYNRIAGMSHHEAAHDLLDARHEMEDKVKDFYMKLSE